jgi:FKBP-type peptidyl-prolyl cis-trans isomerase
MKKRLAFSVTLMLSIFIVSACSHTYTDEEKADYVQQAEAYAKKQGWKYVVLDKSIVIEELKKGEGIDSIQLGSEVSLAYTGRLLSGKKFDQNTASIPFTSPVSGLIGGFQMALIGKKVGSSMRLVIPPQFAYGDKKTTKVPENAILVFDVEVLSIK